MTARPQPLLAPARFLDRSTQPHLATLILLAGISALTQSVFLPSLSGMAVWFGTDYAVMQLAVTGYLGATAAMQLVVGPLSDRFGRRPVMLWGLVLFVLATAGALVSTSVVWFLAFRMAQAVVATALVLSRAIVRDTVPPARAASRLGYVTMGMSLVPMVGPVLGGVLDTLAGWHGAFVLMLVSGGAVLVLAFLDQGETFAPPPRAAPARDRNRDRNRDRGATRALLSSPLFWSYTMVSTFSSGAFFALLGGASLVAGDIYGLSPLWTGVGLATPSIGYLAGNYLSGRFSMRLGIDRMVMAGNAIGVAGLGLSLVLGVAGLAGPGVFFGFTVALGLCNGMVLPNATSGLLSVRPDLAGTASGLSGALTIGGGALIAAVAGVVVTPATGALPLQAIMVASLLLSALAHLPARRGRGRGLAA
ncbi:MAG: MFS transporter [Rubellimicrobium sp.]|nr:MFS transporter [Rubellimicrobium sp.]